MKLHIIMAIVALAGICYYKKKKGLIDEIKRWILESYNQALHSKWMRCFSNINIKMEKLYALI